MPTLTDHIFSESNWCDVTLLGLRWIEDGRDLELTLDVPVWKHERRVRTMCCRWAHEVHIDLSFDRKVGDIPVGGCPFTWDVTAERTPNGGWSMLFDFASVGEIRFKCSEIELDD